jgi:hypothetical protein
MCFRGFFLGLILTSSLATSATARDWLNYDRNEALQRTALILEKMRVPFPFPTVANRCGDRSNLMTCKEPLGIGLNLFVTEVAKGEPNQDFAGFMKGAAGGLYEIRIQLETQSANQSRDVFPSLCVAILAANAPKITLSKARELVDTNLRRAIIRSGSQPSIHRFRHGNITMEIVVERGGYMACTFSAEDDYLL